MWVCKCAVVEHFWQKQQENARDTEFFLGLDAAQIADII